MAALAAVLLSTALVNNIVLSGLLGLGPLMGTSRRFDDAFVTAAATLVVLTVTATLAYVLEHALLAPFGWQYLRTFVFALVLAVAAQASELVIRRRWPLLEQRLGNFVPLIMLNTAALGVALLATQKAESFLVAVCSGLGAGLGFALVLLTLTALRERLAAADVPAAFRDVPIALLTAGIMALAFMGFTGLVQR
jgi:electron transport complex protein RnfA